MNDLISKYSIGIEIEVKFRYYFPEIFEKWFKDGTPFILRSEEEQDHINSEISKIESYLLPKLEATTQDIPRGKDKYWEFAFNPTYNITELSNRVEDLRRQNLIPDGEHSLHITIGGLTPTKRIYHALSLMELEFLKKERISSGFSPKGWSNAWAKKGRGGIYIKRDDDLISADIGVELRTLMLYPELTIEQILSRLVYLIDAKDTSEKCKYLLDKFNLPDINWEFPDKKREIWMKFIECFDEMKQEYKSLESIRCIGLNDISDDNDICTEVVTSRYTRCNKCEERASRIMHHNRMINRLK